MLLHKTVPAGTSQFQTVIFIHRVRSAVIPPFFSEVIPYDLIPNAKMSLQMIHLKGYQLEPMRMAARITGFGSRW